MDKRRPVVILSPDRRNEAASDVIVVPCFSSGRRIRWHVNLQRGEGGLPGASVAKCEQITTVPREFIEREIGMLPEQRIREIERALLSALGIMP